MTCWVFCLAALLGLQSTSMAQCALTFNPNPGVGTVTIETYWTITGSATSSGDLALFQDTVTVGNPTVPAGTYLGWCIDVAGSIGNGPTSYNVLMYSSCDPSLDKELAALGSYPVSDLNASAAQWNAVNYILNNKVGSYWDVQVAIWNFVGGPWTQLAGYPTANTANVNAMVANATKNAGTWQPGPGNVIAVVLAIPPTSSSAGTPPTQLTCIEVPYPCSQMVCCPCPSQNCQGGSVWCNAHLTCSPGQPCNVFCRNSSVTFTCKDGQTYTYPVPDCQVCFSQNSPSCVTPNSCFANGKWCTTVPCGGDSQIFLSGCGIPWQSDFANCTSVCWTGSFSCDTPGIQCSWQCGTCCYNANLSNCSTIQVKPCYQNSCGYPGGDCAGTPENFKSYCQGGNNNNNYNNYNNNNNNNNYCGSFSSSGWFTCK
jgi:hypothetical protein